MSVNSTTADATPRILFLSTRFPFPLDTGGKIRTANILRQLASMFRVTVVSNVESPKDDRHLPRIREITEKFIGVPWSEPAKYTPGFYWKVLRRSLSSYPVTVLNDYSPGIEAAVLHELSNDRYDLLICDFVQSAINLERVTGVPILIFQHNVEATIPKRHHETATNPLMRLFWKSQYEKILRFEQEKCRACDAIIAVSDIDRDRIKIDYAVENVHSIPTGVDTEYFAPNHEVEERERLVFVGSMDWEPNDDAMTFFLESVLPRIREKRPEVELVIVGRKPSPRLQGLAERAENVTLTGRVEDTRPYIAEGKVFVVPIRIGGGTRIKIYEALSMEKAIVSTSVGAEGLPLEHDHHILFADDAKSFADATVALLENEERRHRLAATGRAYVLENFQWPAVGRVFARICEETIAAKSGCVKTG